MHINPKQKIAPNPISIPSPDKVNEVVVKVRDILNKNGFSSPSVEVMPRFRSVTIWHKPDVFKKRQIADLLNANGAVDKPNTTRDSFELDGVNIFLSMSRVNPRPYTD